MRNLRIPQKINSVSSYIKAIFDLRSSKMSEYSLSSYWFFRGQKNASWGMCPNIFRNDALKYEFDSIETAIRQRPYLYSLRQGDKNDENIKRGIINIFLRAVYLYDDRFTLVLNGSDTPIIIDDILLDEIEEGLKGDLTNCEGCSSLVADAPPKKKDTT